MKNFKSEMPADFRFWQKIFLQIAALLRNCPWKGKSFIWLYSQTVLDLHEHYDVKVRFAEGYTLVLDIKEFWQRLMLAGSYDTRELWVLKNILRSGDVFFDVGANVGYYAVAAAARIKVGQVYAFEPNPAMAACLSRNCAENPGLNIKTFEAAVSDKPGETSFYIPPDNGFQSVEGSILPRPDFSEKKVQAVTLDKICHELMIKKINLAKIDVEGHEGGVLRGAKNILESGQLESVLCEVSNENRGEIFPILSKFNFERIIDLRTFKDVTLQSLQPGLANVFFLRGACARRWRDLGWQKWLT